MSIKTPAFFREHGIEDRVNKFSAIELSIDDLYRFSATIGWVDVCKLSEAHQ